MEAPEVITLTVPYVSAPERTHHIVAYRWGKADAPAIICIHGLTRNARDFDFLARALAQAYQVIAVDMPGRGNSEWLELPQEYSVPFYIANLSSVFAQLKLTRFDWVGTSMGGIIGMVLAAHAPAMIRKLVLNDVGAFIPAAALSRIGDYVGRNMIFASQKEAEAVLRERYAPFGIQDEHVWQHMFAHSTQPLGDGTVRLAYDPAIATMLVGANPPMDVDMWDTWGKITAPTLIIRGAQSDLLLDTTVKEMCTRKPNAEAYVAKGAGHAPSLSNAAEIQVIMDFLNRA